MADNLNQVTTELNQLQGISQRTNELLLRMDSNFSNGISQLTGIIQTDAQARAEERRDQDVRDKHFKRMFDSYDRTSRKDKSEGFSLIDKLSSSFFGSLFGVTSYAGASGALSAFAGKYGWLGLVGGALAAIMLGVEKENGEIVNTLQEELGNITGINDDVIEGIKELGGYSTLLSTIKLTSSSISKAVGLFNLKEIEKTGEELTGVTAGGKALKDGGLIGKSIGQISGFLKLSSRIFFPITTALAGFESMSAALDAYDKAKKEGKDTDTAVIEAVGGASAGLIKFFLLEPMQLLSNLSANILDKIGMENAGNILRGLSTSLEWLMNQLYITLPNVFGGLYDLLFKEKSEEEIQKSIKSANNAISSVLNFFSGFFGIEIDPEAESANYVKAILQVYNFLKSVAKAFIAPIDDAIGELAADIAFEFKDFWDAETPEEAGRAFRKGLINSLEQIVKNTIIAVRDMIISLTMPISDVFVKLYRWFASKIPGISAEGIMTSGEAYETYLKNFEERAFENEKKLSRSKFIFDYYSGNLDRFFQDLNKEPTEQDIKQMMQTMGIWREYNSLIKPLRRTERELDRLEAAQIRNENLGANLTENEQQILTERFNKKIDELLAIESQRQALRTQAIEALNKAQNERSVNPTVFPIPMSSGGSGSGPSVGKQGAAGSDANPRSNVGWECPSDALIGRCRSYYQGIA